MEWRDWIAEDKQWQADSRPPPQPIKCDFYCGKYGESPCCYGNQTKRLKGASLKETAENCNFCGANCDEPCADNEEQSWRTDSNCCQIRCLQCRGHDADKCRTPG